jgi:hypothetical protein
VFEPSCNQILHEGSNHFPGDVLREMATAGNVASVDELTPRKAFGFGTGESFGQARWRFAEGLDIRRLALYSTVELISEVVEYRCPPMS